MEEIILHYFNEEMYSLNVTDVLVTFMAALLLAAIIFCAYRFCHSSAVYNGRFNVSLVMLTLITTLVMSVIGNNIALSLGMVGALSIVRFRTAIKDPRDTTYIFWCIAVGICCGVQSFLLGFIGSGFIFVAMLILGSIKSNDRYLLILEVNKKDANVLVKIISKYYAGKAVLSVQNANENTVEFIYEISQKLIKKQEKINNKSIMEYLDDKVKTKRLSIICQSDEMSR